MFTLRPYPKKCEICGKQFALNNKDSDESIIRSLRHHMNYYHDTNVIDYLREHHPRTSKMFEYGITTSVIREYFCRDFVDLSELRHWLFRNNFENRVQQFKHTYDFFEAKGGRNLWGGELANICGGISSLDHWFASEDWGKVSSKIRRKKMFERPYISGSILNYALPTIYTRKEEAGRFKIQNSYVANLPFGDYSSDQKHCFKIIPFERFDSKTLFKRCVKEAEQGLKSGGEYLYVMVECNLKKMVNVFRLPFAEDIWKFQHEVKDFLQFAVWGNENILFQHMIKMLSMHPSRYSELDLQYHIKNTFKQIKGLNCTVVDWD